ncbi:MAG: type IV-A pilus assembly ATPase PilB [Nitrospinae bacterium]|nr:type IV-A pilus assembly ATPase PilB [Nitrospinota bacterium]
MAVVDERKSSFKRTIQDETKRERLADLLRKDGRITGRQLKEAEDLQKKKGGWIGHTLIKLGYITEDAILQFVSRNMSIPIADLVKEAPKPDAIKMLEYPLAKQHSALPLEVEGGNLVLAMVDPTNFAAIEEIANKTKLAVKTKISKLKDIADAFKKYYEISDEEYKTLLPAEETEEQKAEAKGPEKPEAGIDLGEIISSVEDELEIAAEEEDEDEGVGAGDAALIQLVNGILVKAVNQGVSDIHIEPYEKRMRVRYRKDGTLAEVMTLPLQMKNALTSRIKIMSNLNIAEKRVPQDGRIKIKVSRGRVVDFRVSILPTLFGESTVMRLLDPGKLQVDLTKLGFSQDSLTKFNKAIEMPQGLVLVTGPTGSGKTNTLYSAVNALNTEDVKILTAEDPVEFNFEGINQVLVRNEVGLTFAAALKSFLRQDPEIILVGEIRDIETAEIAVKAAMTGHLVFSTLHTNDCPATVARIIDIGVPPYMVSSALILIVAQRLLRRICTKCKTQVENIPHKTLLDAGYLKEELPTLKIYHGVGCPACNGGYKGRLGNFEVLEATEAVKQAITAKVPEDVLRKIAIKDGMITLRRDGLNKMLEGTTTLEEVLANTVLTKEALPAYLLNPDELIFEDGDLIIREGNTDKNFYQVLQGGLVITKNGKVVGEITQPGEYFGEMSSLLNQPRTATVRSKGKSVVKVFPGDKLRETIDNHPDIAFNIIKSLMTRINEADKRLARLGSERPVT